MSAVQVTHTGNWIKYKAGTTSKTFANATIASISIRMNIYISILYQIHMIIYVIFFSMIEIRNEKVLHELSHRIYID